jgi:hypothetical protein
MNDGDRRRYEMQLRVTQFGANNAADFTGIAATAFSDLSALVNDSESKAAFQLSGLGQAARQFKIKDTARENLRDLMAGISRTAKSMEYAINGIRRRFRFQRNMSDAAMLAQAHSWQTEITPYLVDFEAYGMPNTLVADLTALADALEATFGATASAIAVHVAATADMSDKVRQGMTKVRILDGIVRNVYVNNPGKLAAWLSASHVEKAPKKKKDPTP